MTALASLLVVGLAAAETALAPPPDPVTLLVVPFSTQGGAPDWVGLALADTLLDAAVQLKEDNFLTLKQLDSVLRRRDLKLGDPAVTQQLAPLAKALGATEVIGGWVGSEKGKLVVDGRRIRTADGTPLKAAKVEGAIGQLPQLAQKLAVELGLAHRAGPPTSSVKAMELGARCTFALARQSMAPRSKAVLRKAQLDIAEAFCDGALKADPKLGSARAGRALLMAVKGQLGDARKEAAAANAGPRVVWWAYLVESYAARRAGDSAGARAVLQRAVAARPGFLHALGYLGEEQIEAGDDAGALKTFEQYLARSPGHPWATGKRGRELARLGRKDEAIAITKDALTRSNDPELQIELASRYLDANRDAEAEKVLLAVAGLTPPRPLAFLRLGYLHLRAGRLKEARTQFQRAVSEARREDEARPRALAYADLAQVAGREGIFENALEALHAARREGLRKLPCNEPELVKWKGKPEFDRACSEEGGPAPGTAVDDEDDVIAVELQ